MYSLLGQFVQREVIVLGRITSSFRLCELVEVMGLGAGSMDLCSCYRRVFNRLRASLLHGSAGMPTALGELLQWRSDIVSSWIPVSMRCQVCILVNAVSCNILEVFSL